MVDMQNCVFCCKNNRLILLIISLAFLLVSCLTQKSYMVDAGRAVPVSASETPKGQREEEMRQEAIIGSRPPRCEKRCRSCVNCEAIQVPIVSQHQQEIIVARSRQHSLQKSTSSTTTSGSNENRAALLSRGDDLSNYKPMSWKCKCGSFIFNP